MAVTVAELHALLDLARASLSSADYDSAESYVLQAQVLAAGIPNTTSDGTAVEWPVTLRDLLKTIRETRSRSLTSSVGIQRIKVTVAEVTD